jgi:hypothetical protein
MKYIQKIKNNHQKNPSSVNTHSKQNGKDKDEAWISTMILS